MKNELQNSKNKKTFTGFIMNVIGALASDMYKSHILHPDNHPDKKKKNDDRDDYRGGDDGSTNDPQDLKLVTVRITRQP